jgi:type VI secretion system secreted protein Hcp
MPEELKDAAGRRLGPVSASVSGSDMFLSLQTKKGGQVKGEATTAGHVDDIEVRSMTWGVAAGHVIGGTVATSRRQYRNLVIVKGIDLASTPLMSALATNAEVSQAKLTLRKPGGDALDYFSITLSKARIAQIDLAVDDQGHPTETVAIAFTEIEVEYKRQQSSGISAGSTSFNDVVAAMP